MKMQSQNLTLISAYGLGNFQWTKSAKKRIWYFKKRKAKAGIDFVSTKNAEPVIFVTRRD